MAVGTRICVIEEYYFDQIILGQPGTKCNQRFYVKQNLQKIRFFKILRVPTLQ